MEVIILPSENSAAAIGDLAGTAISELLHRKPDAVLGLPTVGLQVDGRADLVVLDEGAVVTAVIRAGKRIPL